MHPRILTALSVTFPQIICPSKESKPNNINPNMKNPSQESYSNIRNQKALEESAPQHLKRKNYFLNQSPKVVPSKKEKFPLPSSGSIMIVEIYPSKLTIKVLHRNSSGKYQLKPSITITTFPSSWMVAEKESIHIAPSPSWELMICWTKEDQKFYQ